MEENITRPLLSPVMAVAIVFTCFGILIGLWGGSVAEVSRIAGAGATNQGLATTIFGIAGICGMAFAGRIAVSVSIKSRLMAYFALFGTALAGLLHVPGPSAMLFGIFMFSLLAAAVDLSMNSDGLAVEHDMGRPVLSRLHGVSSFGAAAGAISGSWLSVNLGVTATSAFVAIIVIAALAAIRTGTLDRGPTELAGTGIGWYKPDLRVVVVGIIVGVSIAIEIGAILFSTQTIVAQAPAHAAYAGVAGMIYSLVQGTVRLSGDGLRNRFGDRMVIRGSLSTVIAGLCIVVLSPHAMQTVIGLALVGAGTACIVPSGFSLAKRYTGRSGASSISTVAIIGSPFRIVAPFAFGITAASAGFPAGYAVYMVIAILAAMLAFTQLEKPAREPKP